MRAYRNKTGGNRPHYQILLFGIFCLFSFRFVFHFIFVCFSLGLSERNFTTWHSAGYSRRSQRVWRGLFFESASEFTGIDEYVNDQVRRFIQMEGTGPHWGTTEHLVTAKRPLEQDKPIHGHRIKKKQPRPARRLDTWLVHTYARSALPATGQHPGKEQKFNFLAVASQSGSHTCIISRAKKKGTE